MWACNFAAVLERNRDLIIVPILHVSQTDQIHILCLCYTVQGVVLFPLICFCKAVIFPLPIMAELLETSAAVTQVDEVLEAGSRELLETSAAVTQVDDVLESGSRNACDDEVVEECLSVRHGSSQPVAPTPKEKNLDVNSPSPLGQAQVVVKKRPTNDGSSLPRASKRWLPLMRRMQNALWEAICNDSDEDKNDCRAEVINAEAACQFKLSDGFPTAEVSASTPEETQSFSADVDVVAEEIEPEIGYDVDLMPIGLSPDANNGHPTWKENLR